MYKYILIYSNLFLSADRIPDRPTDRQTESRPAVGAVGAIGAVGNWWFGRRCCGRRLGCEDFSKVRSAVFFYSKLSSELTYENFWQVGMLYWPQRIRMVRRTI